MQIYSLSGPSGSGKSSSALAFAHQYKIPAIIDDGLLIINGQKTAGTSAKFEKNALTAVKRATFFDPIHIKDIQKALSLYVVDKILIIGTSDRMTTLIAERLQLGPITRYIHIEDIRTSSEIKIAQYIRKTEGKHIIPVPFKQVEQNFFRRLIQKGMDIFSPKKERIGETTIVLPDFQKGTIHIERKVFHDIIEHICRNNKYVVRCNNLYVQLAGIQSINITIEIINPVSFNIPEEITQLQEDIYESFLQYLNIEFTRIHICIK
ncbi:hypothetical protein IEO70_11585 [Bacillus sp. AGMB 02131]|uniref:Uncharacterized protein n=1 Tax=Peribacillus faecalis TaxID=2772559 RepID=A0A927CZW2_9BACI|nr:hypothetical protein [Peribacillus faecalis]MBD3109000.1 hypothetical protein [Peribacillus faecalis]